MVMAVKMRGELEDFQESELIADTATELFLLNRSLMEKERLLAVNQNSRQEMRQQVDQNQPRDLSSNCQEQAMLRSLFYQDPDYLFVKDRKSRFVIANHAVAADLGCNPRELIGKTDFHFHRLQHGRKYYSDEQRVMSSGAPIVHLEEIVVDFRGQEKRFSTSKLPLYSAQDRIVGLIGICIEISDHKHSKMNESGAER